MRLARISMVGIVALVAISLFLTIATAGLLTVNQTVPSTGIVTTLNIGVYSDSSCTKLLTTLNWGAVKPGNSSIKTVYIKNIGTTPITLAMTKTNWNPTTANGPIILTWNREGIKLNVNQTSTATLTLTVLPNITGIANFSFDVIISGTG